MTRYTEGRRQNAERRFWWPFPFFYCLLPTAYCLLVSGCGYTSRPGIPTHLKTVYVKPFTNKIDLTQLQTGNQNFPLYRPAMETDVTKAIINRFQFTGLLRPSSKERADARIEGELVEFRRDALRYSAAQQVEEWRLNVVVDVRFYDQTTDALLWEESRLTGDATYFPTGTNAESEATALDRAIRDMAKRVVERTIESW